MNEAEARIRLEMMTAHDVDPALAAPEIDALVSMAKRADSEGRAPSDVDWVPTWDLNSSAAKGWELKAGKASARFAFTTDGQTFQRQQVLAHCNRMAATYRRRVAVGI